MNLPIPVVGQEPGPDYATDINNALSIVDGHTHTAGSGVPITPAALNINTDLPINNHFLTQVAGVTMLAQASTPAVGTSYVNGVDLYYRDISGNVIRLTQSGAVAGTPGSISNLVAPASATYVTGTGTFVWQSDTNIAANMDAGSLVLRNLTPNSTFGMTLNPPPALGSNFDITFPTLPSSQKIMTLDNSGNIKADYVVDNFGLTIVSNTIQLGNLGVVNANIANSTITASKLANPISHRVTSVYTSNSSFTVPANVYTLFVEGAGGGGGGGGGSSGFLDNVGNGGGGGGGGAAAPITTYTIAVTPGETYNISVGAGGSGGVGGAGYPNYGPNSGTGAAGVLGNTGNVGGPSTLQINTNGRTAWIFPGGLGGQGGQYGYANTTSDSNACAGGQGGAMLGYGSGGGGSGASGAVAGTGGNSVGGAGAGGGGGGRSTAGQSANGGVNTGPGGAAGTGAQTTDNFQGSGGGGAGGSCPSNLLSGLGGAGGNGGLYQNHNGFFTTNGSNGGTASGGGGGGGGNQSAVGTGGTGGSGYIAITYETL
jgi:hypothetical protein